MSRYFILFIFSVISTLSSSAETVEPKNLKCEVFYVPSDSKKEFKWNTSFDEMDLKPIGKEYPYNLSVEIKGGEAQIRANYKYRRFGYLVEYKKGHLKGYVDCGVNQEFYMGQSDGRDLDLTGRCGGYDFLNLLFAERVDFEKLLEESKNYPAVEYVAVRCSVR